MKFLGPGMRSRREKYISIPAFQTGEKDMHDLGIWMKTTRFLGISSLDIDWDLERGARLLVRPLPACLHEDTARIKRRSSAAEEPETERHDNERRRGDRPPEGRDHALGTPAVRWLRFCTIHLLSSSFYFPHMLFLSRQFDHHLQNEILHSFLFRVSVSVMQWRRSLLRSQKSRAAFLQDSDIP